MPRQLYTFHGPSSPGLLERLLQAVARAGGGLHDVEQRTRHGQATLALLVTPAPEVDELLAAEARALGLALDVCPVAETAAGAPREEWVVTVVAAPVAPSTLAAVLRAIEAHAALVTGVRRLSEGALRAVEVSCSLAGDEASRAALKRDLLGLAASERFDVALQRDDAHRRARGLVVMDMDSTLIRIEVIDELAKAAGAGAKVAEITRRAMAGEMDYDESLRQRVALLSGLDASHLERIARDLPLSDGAEALVGTLKALGFRTAVLSGGFDVPARALQARLGLDAAHSNVLEVQDGRLTGRVSGRIVNARVKAELLEQLAREAGIPLEQTVAFGDGANDMLMLQRAGLGLAFHGKPRLREAADGAIDGPLDGALYLMGLEAPFPDEVPAGPTVDKPLALG
jgi:phosphoserine phosphatase